MHTLKYDLTGSDGSMFTMIIVFLLRRMILCRVSEDPLASIHATASFPSCFMVNSNTLFHAVAPRPIKRLQGWRYSWKTERSIENILLTGGTDRTTVSSDDSSCFMRGVSQTGRHRAVPSRWCSKQYWEKASTRMRIQGRLSSQRYLDVLHTSFNNIFQPPPRRGHECLGSFVMFLETFAALLHLPRHSML